MNRFISIIICYFITICPVFPQILKGKITNQSGEPVPSATVYIRELKQGTTSNMTGDYEIRLPRGKYTIICQSLGYEQVSVSLTITDETVIRNISLSLQYYQIPEVRISATGEDPAYGIMRKAIGMAPYYLNNISHYKANVYLKGNLKIDKIPRLIKRSIEKEARKERKSGGTGETVKEGEVYLMESYNEIEFTAPEKYVQKVLSYNSTFPEEGNEISPMQYISASFYQPVIADLAISPLSPDAFSHYNFKYLGASPQGNFSINKIAVIPKRKSQQLFEGTVYIIDELWCLQSVDLTIDNLAGKIRIEQLCIPVQDDIWMPVSDKFDVKISILGFKADAGYAVSVKYDEVIPNTALKKPAGITFRGNNTANAASDTIQNKKRKQIDRILSKEELTNRDMMRLSKLMKQESEKSIPDSVRKNLEIKDNTTHVIETDAGRKDSAYWAAIRPIPLSELEMKRMHVTDSIRRVSEPIQSKSDTLKTEGKNQKDGGNSFAKEIKNVSFGNTWGKKDGLRFRFSGLFDPELLNFNTVDGFVYGMDFRLSKTWKDKKSLGIYPDVRWAFSRQQLMWRLNANYKFGGVKQKEIFIRSGMTSRDISTGGGIDPLLNTVTSLFFKLNYPKFYNSDFFRLGYRSEITNGLTLELNGLMEYRYVLANTTGFSIINASREYTPNIPVNRYLASGADPLNAMRDQNHAALTAKITYIPFQKYRMDGGAKIPAGSDWPSFILSWEHGINDFNESGFSVTRYDMIRAEIFRKKDLGAFKEFRWRIRAGGFTDNRKLTFYDFFHFNQQPLPLLLKDYEDAFMNPFCYSLSTPESYFEVHLNYATPYFLLKMLPGLSNTLMRENLRLSLLGSRYRPAYTEIGYSLSEIFLFFEAGVYAGFDGTRYRNLGIKFILKLN
jgi:hypothetical protein